MVPAWAQGHGGSQARRLPPAARLAAHRDLPARVVRCACSSSAGDGANAARQDALATPAPLGADDLQPVAGDPLAARGGPFTCTLRHAARQPGRDHAQRRSSTMLTISTLHRAAIAILWSLLPLGPTHLQAQPSMASTLQLGANDLGGIVTSANGPEAGVW